MHSTSGSSIAFGRAELCSGSEDYECPCGSQHVCVPVPWSWKLEACIHMAREFSCILPQCSATIHERNITFANVFPMKTVPFLT